MFEEDVQLAIRKCAQNEHKLQTNQLLATKNVII